MTKSEFVQIMKGVILLIDFRNDFQFDKGDPGYLGFLNTGVPLLSDEDGETFRFIIRNLEFYNPVLDKLGLMTEMGFDDDETVFVLTEDVKDLK
jgi:hypothetical protein